MIRYYLNDEHLEGWDEPDEDWASASIQVAVDNLTDYQHGDVLRMEYVEYENDVREVVHASVEIALLTHMDTREA